MTKTSRHCRRYRCQHVVGCLCNCKACAKLRPVEEMAESRRNWERHQSSEPRQSAEK
jgi:hypothetical protein